MAKRIPTVEDYLKPFIGDRLIYDYNVFGPLSLDDTCRITARVTYMWQGSGDSRKTEFYEIDFSNSKKPPVVKQIRSF